MSNMGGYYGSPGYGSMPPMHLMRGTLVPTSGMDYLPDQFQGSDVILSEGAASRSIFC